MAGFDKKLKAAQDMWAKARERSASSSGRFAEFEDGRYMARIVKGEIGESQSSGRLQVIWTFRFEDGEYEGQDKLDFSGLETENNLYYLSERVKQLGYEPPEDLQEIKDILADLNASKPLCKIRLKTKGEFQNVYIDRVFAGAAEEEGEDQSGPTTAAAEEEDASEGVEEEVEEEIEEEVEESEGEELDEVELAIGMSVIASTSKGDVKGTVLEIMEAENKVRVKLDDGRTVRLDTEKISVVEEIPEEPPAPPAKKKAAAPAPAPAPAPSKARRR